MRCDEVCGPFCQTKMENMVSVCFSLYDVMCLYDVMFLYVFVQSSWLPKEDHMDHES